MFLYIELSAFYSGGGFMGVCWGVWGSVCTCVLIFNYVQVCTCSLIECVYITIDCSDISFAVTFRLRLTFCSRLYYVVLYSASRVFLGALKMGFTTIIIIMYYYESAIRLAIV